VPLPIKLITGLGNPGPDYSVTRHNAGFWLVDAIARHFNLVFHKELKFRSEICRLVTEDHDCWLCKPTTYMNESGYAVQAISNFYRIPLEQTLIVHDEIDLEVGSLRLKKGGGHGGHNGLRDIIQQTGGKEFSRLRIGVGHPGNRDLVTPYVLGRPSMDDREHIIAAIDSCMDVITLILDGELQKVMNILHKKDTGQAED
jgi:PTH1 family peptidyl-tRNA hydrolase